tara:strand:- start:1653 stop:3323 length:1671 start_codon:yes stop_codon:yes gene_type:complete
MGETDPSGTGCFVRIGFEKIEVEFFGAKGDGQYYDSPAVSGACNLAKEYVDNATGFGQNAGATVKFNRGKYRISSATSINTGVTLEGIHSGLVNEGDAASSGTVLLLSDTKPDGTAWTSSDLIDGNTITKRVMFSVDGAGPIKIQSLGAITENNDSVDSVFVLAGNGYPVPRERSGISQGVFRDVRVFSFESVIRGSRIEDLVVDSCGFEFNRWFLDVVPTDAAASDIGYARDIMITNTRFFELFGFVKGLPDRTEMRGVTLSSCFLSILRGGTYRIFNVAEGAIEGLHFSSCDFSKPDTSSGDLFRLGTASGSIKDVSFSSCKVSGLGMLSYDASVTGDQIFDVDFSSTVFKDSETILGAGITKGLSVSGCSYSGLSKFLFSGAGLSFVGNSFENNALGSGFDFDIADASNVVATGNTFRGEATIAFRGSLSNIKVFGNVNGKDYLTYETAALLEQPGNWGLSASIPPFCYRDAAGNVRFAGWVTSPATSASPDVAISLPAGYSPKFNVRQTIWSAVDGVDDYVIIAAGAGGSEFTVKFKKGTAQTFDVSSLNYS